MIYFGDSSFEFPDYGNQSLILGGFGHYA